MVPNSKAASVAESFPAQPPIIINKRYNKYLLVQVYIRDLLTMMMNNAIDFRVKTDLPKLYNILKEKFKSFEIVARTHEKCGDFLIPSI